MASFSIFRPQTPPNVILFNSAHSGTQLPSAFLKKIAIDPALLHYSGDIFVDQLIKKTPFFGATILINHQSRTYVDTNRSPLEIDPDMFVNLTKNTDFDKTDKVMRGFGVFSRKAFNNQDIYDDKLPESEIRYRLDHVYYPVHNALKKQLDNFYQKKGFYLLLDCHSMPSHAFIDPGLSNDLQADVVIGNCFGQSCSDELSQHIRKFLAYHGLKVAFNIPYSGGYNTQHYGSAKDHKNALQLEFNRALYMDEKSLEPHEGLLNLQHVITELSENLNDNLCGFFPAK